MAVLVIAGVAAVIGLVFLLFSLKDVDPARIANWIRRFGGWAALGLAAGVFAAMTAAGKFSAAIILFAAAAPILFRLMRASRRSRGPSPGRRSTVDTRYLRMTLDHDSGGISGEVARGVYAGRPLEDLTRAEALDLLAQCDAEDPESARLIRAWMARSRPEWASGGDGARAASRGGMSLDEAREVLGVGPHATAEEIKAAHKRLMRSAHPDAGGSDWLAARVNEAKEALLNADHMR